MPIPLACGCGRQLNLADHLAGKRIKCPSCAAALKVPGGADDPAEWDFEVVEDEEPVTVNPAPAPADAPIVEEAPPADKNKSGKGKRRSGRSSALTRMYVEQAEAELRRDEVRAKAAGWGHDQGHGDWTLFNVHVTAGVISGAAMLLIGILCIALILIFQNQFQFGPRVYVGAIVLPAIGAITLIKSLFFGEED